MLKFSHTVKDQRGVNLVDVIAGMVLSAVIGTAAMTVSLTTLFTQSDLNDLTVVTQYQQGLLAKADTVRWEKLGFRATDVPDSQSTVTKGGVQYRTVLLDNTTATDSLLVPDSTVVLHGKRYAIHTDITWNNLSTSDALPSASSFGSKHVFVTMKWTDRNGVPRHTTVDRSRSATAGEAIPTGIPDSTAP